ncbi:MAG TPA: glycoside hydrolase family 27 protein [Terriglobia bacterium]|nr:glycoside hydrolase family 27 protein [Terriglobia bacterium]
MCRTHSLGKLVLAVILFCPILTFAADLNGDWIATAPRPEGGQSQLMLRLKQDGPRFTGILSFPSRDLAIEDGQVSGNDFSFSVQAMFGDNARTLRYAGSVTGAVMTLTASQPNGGTRTFTGRHATAAESAANWPERIPPPALHAVPDNGLARTPPMGWNSWNHFHGQVDDKTIRETADAMVANGMKAAGYLYVNIDDTWQGTRDAQGNIQANSKFPDMKALADYVHSKGLKIGIYSGPGTKTCAGFEGSYGHEEQDARTYAAWGIDYLKYDWCSAGKIYQDSDMQAVYQKMGDALRATGRPIVYSLCQYGRDEVWKWGPEVSGNLWRTTGDISDNWKSMIGIAAKQEGLEAWAKPGHWNDPDMLEVGNGGMTDTEYRTHFTIWSILGAPLLAGNDLRSVNRATLDILENPEVIAVDQDSLGRQGHRISQNGEAMVWARKLADGGQAVALINEADKAAKVSVSWSQLGLSASPSVRDLWTHTDRGHIADGFSSEVPSHGVVLIKVK